MKKMGNRETIPNLKQLFYDYFLDFQTKNINKHAKIDFNY